MKKSPEQIKALIKSRLETGDLVIWGYNDKAREFYYKYKESFHIKGCITEQKNHPDYLDNESRIPVVGWEKYDMKENDYIIIFAGPLMHIENQILASGLKVFEEYVDSTVAEVVLTKRKIAIMAGACQTAVICNFLWTINDFKEEYMLIRFSIHFWKSRWSLRLQSFVKNMCELYICMQHEEDNPLYFSPEELPKTCRIITLPSALVRLYWPQMGRSWKSALNSYFKKDNNRPDHGPFEYGDENINRMIEEGKDVEEIITVLTGDNFYTEEQVERHINTMLRMLEYEEDKCDIKIASYIRSNFKKKMLYRDMAHMHTCLVCEMVRAVLRYLGLGTDEVDKMEQLKDNPTIQEYETHCTEVPIYPSVAKYLGLEWWDKDIKYDVRFYNGIKKITFEEYIRRYYSVCSKTKQILEEW